MPPISSRDLTDYINSISKTINDNGCWIPINKPKSNGYVQVGYRGKLLMLHRLAMVMKHNISYDDPQDTLHNEGCDRRCFNPDHVNPGSHKENMNSIEHHNSKKLVCPKCGGIYSRIRKYENGRYVYRRRCNTCRRVKYANSRSDNE